MMVACSGELPCASGLSFRAEKEHCMSDQPTSGAPEKNAEVQGTADSSVDEQTLTTRQGHPVYDNQNVRTVGSRGPTTLENYHFIEKITHFDRERIPERVVHARGAGAHGYFEAYGKIGNEPASKYTRAKVLNQTGVKTPMFVPRPSPAPKRAPRRRAIRAALR